MHTAWRGAGCRCWRRLTFYGVMLVNPAKYPHVKREAGMKLTATKNSKG